MKDIAVYPAATSNSYVKFRTLSKWVNICADEPAELCIEISPSSLALGTSLLVLSWKLGVK